MDRIWLLQAAVETEVDLQLPQTRCVLYSDSTRNEQVKTSVCHKNFDGSSANVTLFSSLKILLVWEVFGWLRVICILTKACSFASWKILTQTRYFMFYQNKINCTTLKQTKKNERLVLWRPKISYKPGNNFVKCSHLIFASFPLFTK